MGFRHTITPRFHEVDRVGIVFFGRAFEYAHICLEELLHAALGGPDAMEAMGLAMPLVHVEADYRAPMRHAVPIDIEARVTRCTARSITFEFVLGPHCTVSLKHAFRRLSDFSPFPRPAAFDAGLRGIGVELPADG